VSNVKGNHSLDYFMINVSVKQGFKVKSEVNRVCSRMNQTAFIEVISPIFLVGTLTNTNMKSSKGELDL